MRRLVKLRLPSFDAIAEPQDPAPITDIFFLLITFSWGNGGDTDDNIILNDNDIDNNEINSSSSSFSI